MITTKKFTLTAAQVEALRQGKNVPGYEGCIIECDTETGDYDSSKGAMTDYSICLYDVNGNLLGEATGGYYTGVTGHCFDDDEYEFELNEKTPTDEFNDFLKSVASDSGTLQEKLDKIKTKIKELE